MSIESVAEIQVLQGLQHIQHTQNSLTQQAAYIKERYGVLPEAYHNFAKKNSRPPKDAASYAIWRVPLSIAALSALGGWVGKIADFRVGLSAGVGAGIGALLGGLSVASAVQNDARFNVPLETLDKYKKYLDKLETELASKKDSEATLHHKSSQSVTKPDAPVPGTLISDAANDASTKKVVETSASTAALSSV
ncbi:MAG: hypothetical protein K2Q12_09885 [Rickettsiales bacterium]|nr:hypothetical protein [Rickettsiales bacterium]